MGDFNARLGKETGYRATVCRNSKHEISSENGKRLIDFAMGKNVIVASTRFPHKDVHKVAWITLDGSTFNQIDHIHINKRHASSIIDVRSYRGAICDSDHFMVKEKFKQRIERTGRKKGKENEGSVIMKS